MPCVVIFFASVLFAFFWKAVFLGEVILPSHVLYVFYPWSAQLPESYDTMPQNDLLSDAIIQHYPFARFVADSLKQGILPLWNPYQGCGAPFIGNDQSAAFFPLNVLYYVLPFQTAWNAIIILMLFIAGFSSYLFIRSINVGRIGSIASGISFMFCGYLIVWLEAPHVKTAIWLPLLFLLTERLAIKRRFNEAALLGVLVGVQFLGGHIETSLFLMTAMFLYFLFRAYVVWRDAHRSVLKLGILFMFSLVLGILLGSIQLLPFLEYLTQSQALVARHGPNNFYLPPTAMITLLISNFFGNPTNGTYWGSGPNMNYNESVGGYAGVPALFFALLAIVHRARDRFVLFFLGLAFFCMSVIYKFPVMYEFVTSLPFFDVTANHRLLLVLAFALSVLGGIGVDLLISGRTSVVRTLSVSLALALVPSLLPYFILTQPTSQLQSLVAGVMVWSSRLSKVAGYIAFSLVFFLAILIGLTILAILPHRRKNVVKILAVLVVLVFLVDSFSFAQNYNPLVSANLAVYQRTGSINYLVNDTSIFRILPLGWNTPPNTAMVYRLQDIRTCDAMGIRQYQEFMELAGTFEGSFQITEDYESPLLNLMNVKYVTVPTGGLPLNLTLDINQDFNNLPAGEITRSNSYGQTFVSNHNNLSAISILMATYGRRNMYTTIFHLKESTDSSTDIVSIAFNNSDVTDNAWRTFYFSPITNSANRTFYFYFSSTDATSGNAITSWSSSRDVYSHGQIFLNGIPVEGDLTFRTFYSSAESRRFSLVYNGLDADIWRNNDFVSRAFIVHRVVVISDDGQALEYLKGKLDLNFGEFAIIDEEVPSEILSRLDNVPIHDYSNVTTISYEPNKVALQAYVENDGFLILSDNWFPGWMIYVDGKPSRMYRADYTFRAVFLQRGDHTVEFVYDPWPFKVGTYLLFIALAITLCIVIYEQRGRISIHLSAATVARKTSERK